MWQSPLELSLVLTEWAIKLGRTSESERRGSISSTLSGGMGQRPVCAEGLISSS